MGALSWQLATRERLWVIPIAASVSRKTLAVYIEPWSLCSIAPSAGCLKDKIISVSKANRMSWVLESFQATISRLYRSNTNDK